MRQNFLKSGLKEVTTMLYNIMNANVCFNDGHNNWDSQNGANYRFTKGTYTFSNGTITAM